VSYSISLNDHVEVSHVGTKQDTVYSQAQGQQHLLFLLYQYVTRFHSCKRGRTINASFLFILGEKRERERELVAASWRIKQGEGCPILCRNYFLRPCDRMYIAKWSLEGYGKDIAYVLLNVYFGYTICIDTFLLSNNSLLPAFLRCIPLVDSFLPFSHPPQ